jgi:hypothetical protein
MASMRTPACVKPVRTSRTRCFCQTRWPKRIQNRDHASIRTLVGTSLVVRCMLGSDQAGRCNQIGGLQEVARGDASRASLPYGPS